MAALADFRAAASVLLDRYRFGQLAGFTFGGRRNTYAIFGYPQVITAWDYREKYARGGIAKAIVDAYPAATWRGGVELYEDEDPNVDTEFESAFKALNDRLNFWQILQQTDTLAGLSTFAVLLIGAEGKVDEELPKGGDVKFLKPFSGGGGRNLLNQNRNTAQDSSFECAARVTEYDVDPNSERFGEPLYYSIRVANVNLGYSLVKVHWSRVIHVAEGCLEDNVFGVPVLESVFNLILDLEKVTGGGSEAFFLRANQGLHLDVDKDMGLPGQTSAGLSTSERADLKDKAEELQHQLQRVLVTRGVTATQLGSDVANFGPSADAILKQIAGSKGIPMRILTGSEMGTLASEQDAANFDSRVQDRRTGYAGPKIVRRTVDRLIKYEILPTPVQYEVGWPVEENMDEKGKADFALQLATTNKTQGTIVFTDDEIRDMAFDKTPLTSEEKQPVTQAIRVDDNLDTKNALDAPEMKAALRALEIAIENDDIEAVGRLIGLNDGPHNYGSTQVQLPSDVAAKLFAFGRTISDADIYEPEGGRETDAHVTVKYGLLEPDAAKLFEIVARRGSLSFTMGRTGMFAAPDYDVVFVNVNGPDLADMHAGIGLGMACAPSDYGSYRPHATVAYVKSGTGHKYTGWNGLDGVKVTVNTITMSDTEGNKTEVSLV